MIHHSPISPQTLAPQCSTKPASNQPNYLAMSKSRLLEHTQRLGMPLPMYQTTNEGFQHAPKFRCTVLVDGSSYTSTNTFVHLKAAEQDVSRVALDALTQKMKDEGYHLICKDTVFCKSILNEYSGKMNLELPTYTTIQPEGLLSVFLSNVAFNGATYTGEVGKSKRDAEQLAARAAILSIMGNPDSGTIIYEIIKCKFKFFAALSEVTNSNNTQDSFVPAAVTTGANLGCPLSKGKELEIPGCTNTMLNIAIPKTCSGQLSNIPATYQTFHEFKKPQLVPSAEAITPPIVFVPPVLKQSPALKQSPVLKQSLGVASSSAKKKRNRKNKKAKRKNPA